MVDHVCIHIMLHLANGKHSIDSVVIRMSSIATIPTSTGCVSKSPTGPARSAYRLFGTFAMGVRT